MKIFDNSAMSAGFCIITMMICCCTLSTCHASSEIQGGGGKKGTLPETFDEPGDNNYGGHKKPAIVPLLASVANNSKHQLRKRRNAATKNHQENSGSTSRQVGEGNHYDANGSKKEKILTKRMQMEYNRPTSFPLGNIRPEGTIRGHGPTIYVSHFFFGGVSAVDVLSGTVQEIVPDKGFQERGGIGLEYYKGALFVGGGGPMGLLMSAAVHVYDASTGDELASCQPDYADAQFMNEVTIKDGMAYITDSGRSKLMVMDADAALQGNCQVSSIDLPEQIFNLGPDIWGANGIAPFHDGLIIVHETDGSAFYLDLKNQNSITQIIQNGGAPTADGLVIIGNKMYITQNLENKISMWKISRGEGGVPVGATKLGDITSELYRSPATSVIFRGRIYSVNARFDTLGFPDDGEEDPETYDEDFDLVSVPLRLDW